MPSQEKLSLWQEFMGMWENMNLYLAKSAWLAVSIFGVTTKLAHDAFKGVKTTLAQKIAAYIMGVFVGLLMNLILKYCEVTNENFRAFVVACAAINAYQIIDSVLGIKWNKIINTFIDNIIRSYQGKDKK